MRHAVTGEDIFAIKSSSSIASTAETAGTKIYILHSTRYSSELFHGIMPDTGAAGISTAGEPQYLALQKLDPTVKLNTSSVGSQTIQFGKGSTTSLGTIQVNTPFGTITFHVVPTATPFLYCLQDMDTMGVKLDNILNVLI